MTVEFRDPPARAGAPVGVTTFHRLRAVQDRPGRWAVIARLGTPGSAASYVSRIRRHSAWRPAGGFEFTVRSLPDGGAEVYAMSVNRNRTGA
jgi:hypothetical protein